MIVIKNISSLPIWYREYVSTTGVDPKMESVNDYQAIYSPDGLTVYLADRQVNSVYIFNYNNAGNSKLNWQSTFAMMLGTFNIIIE